MKKNISKNIYSTNHNNYFDKITVQNRSKMLSLIQDFLIDKNLNDILDIGSTNDFSNESSNFLIRNLKNFKIYKSISDQKIELPFFSKSLNKSIIDNFTDSELNDFKSDVVISNATIEHVGNLSNQIKMCENIIKLSKKYFIIITPNRFHPVDFHSKLPLIHWLPKKIHRNILSFIGMKFLSKEENLNLLSHGDLVFIMGRLKQLNYEIKYTSFLFFKSNLLLFGKKD